MLRSIFYGGVVAILTGIYSTVLALQGASSIPVLFVSLAVGFMLTRIEAIQRNVPLFCATFALVFGTAWLASQPAPPTQMSAFLAKITLQVTMLVSMALLVVSLARSGSRQGYWLVWVFAMAAFIAFLSGDAGGADPFLLFFKKLGLGPHAADLMVILTRKTIHFTYYGFMGYSAFRGSKLPWLGFSYPTVIAVFDETRQHFYASQRTGSAWDVVLDLLGVSLFMWFARRVREPDSASS